MLGSCPSADSSVVSGTGGGPAAGCDLVVCSAVLDRLSEMEPVYRGSAATPVFANSSIEVGTAAGLSDSAKSPSDPIGLGTSNGSPRSGSCTPTRACGGVSLVLPLCAAMISGGGTVGDADRYQSAGIAPMQRSSIATESRALAAVPRRGAGRKKVGRSSPGKCLSRWREPLLLGFA